MNSIRNFFPRMGEGLRRFMTGRYGSDQYSKFILWVAFAFIILSFFVRNFIVEIIVVALIIYSYFRMFSKNFPKRSAENEKYLEISDKVKGFFRGRKRRFNDRKTYRYFKCPSCGQQVRVPKGKGHIRITCPKCKTQFERTV